MAYRRNMYGHSACSSPCAPKCVKPSRCPPKPICPEEVLELANSYPFKEHFNCMNREELMDLLRWCESFRLFGNFDSHLSVIYAALHHRYIGTYHELEFTALQGVAESTQFKRTQRKDFNGWAATIWGEHYLDLMRLPRRFQVGGSYR